jgi:hypothetical protein
MHPTLDAKRRAHGADAALAMHRRRAPREVIDLSATQCGTISRVPIIKSGIEIWEAYPLDIKFAFPLRTGSGGV